MKGRLRVLRLGADDLVTIMRKVLFVCTGNTCRSPMAKCVFDKAAKECGLDATAECAGMHTQDGLPYAANSVEAMAELGIKLVGTSKQITPELLEECDLVFGLTYQLNTSLVASFPKYSEKIYRFPLDVPDPFGGDLGMYKRSLSRITEGIKRIIAAMQSGKL